MVSGPLATLAAALAAEGTLPVYIVQGEERLLVDEAIRLILTAAVGRPDDPMAIERVDLAEPGRGARDVLAACRSLGLFTPRVAVLVRAAESLDTDRMAADRGDIASYVNAPSRDATLILVATKLDGKSALVKRVKKHGRVLSFDPLRQRDVPEWVSAEARRLGHAMDGVTARLVAELVGTSLQQIRLVVDQLSLYVGPGRPIEEPDVVRCLVATRAHGIFELVDAVGQRRSAVALGHLRSMLEHREPPLRILSMLTRHFRMLWQMAAARAAGLGLDQATADLGLHPYQAKKLWSQSAQFQPFMLRAAYEGLFEADLRLKSKGLDDPLVMEQLVLGLCA